jgi:hypothetical protein
MELKGMMPGERGDISPRLFALLLGTIALIYFSVVLIMLLAVEQLEGS